MGDDDTASDVRMNDDDTIEIIGGNGVYLLGPVALPVPPPPPSPPHPYTLAGLDPGVSGIAAPSFDPSAGTALSGTPGVTRELEVYERLKSINDDESGLLNLGQYLELLRRAVLNLDARLKGHHM